MRRVTKKIINDRRRKFAVEPVIGHAKSEHRTTLGVEPGERGGVSMADACGHDLDKHFARLGPPISITSIVRVLLATQATAARDC